MEREASHQAGEKIKLIDEVNHLKSKVKELKILVEELRIDIVDKESHLNHLQKKNVELSSSLSKAKDEAIKKFKVYDAFTKILDENYTVGFKDFCQDAREAFPRVDFDSIRLCVAVESSLLPSSSEDVDIDDDGTTSLLPKDSAQ